MIVTKIPLDIGDYADIKPVYDMLNNCAEGFKKYCILLTAVEIGIFDRLVVPQTIRDISHELKTDLNIISNVCEALKIMGLVFERSGLYENTEISNLFLRTDSPLAQHNVLKNLQSGLRLWENLPKILKEGPITLSEEKFFANNLIHSLADEALCGELQRTVSIIAELPEFKKAKRLLDLGGGHGLYAIAFTKINPDLVAHVYDFPGVIDDTRKYIEKYEAERVKVISGNFFADDIGEEYDVIFFSSNPGGKNPRIVPRIYESLKKNGLFINKHCFYSKGEGSKNILLDIEWNLTTFEGVQKGNKVYTFNGDLFYDEYIELLEKYFSIINIVDSPDFTGYPLSKIGDTLDSKIIIASRC
ncbi:methyltransferase [Desulfofarcimen acetoxidans]|uniref:methyltransferase n=1 Tax=Desulfofarcimen acetoxidans TaxID=58138 RepID=UPI0012FEB30D